MTELGIGERIKMLRTERGLTQDKFAKYLGVDCRVLDRWERGEEYPPIALIPKIACYFEVTCDLLMCMDEVDNSEMVREYIDKYRAFISLGNLPDAIGIMREGLVHFPNNYRLKCMLMYALYLSCNRPAAVKHFSPEIMSISEDILSGCTDDAIRLEAKRVLCLHCYDDLHDAARARSIAQTLPDRSSSREDILPHVSEGVDKLRAIEANIASYADSLNRSIIELTETAPELTPEFKRDCLEFTLALRKKLYSSGDYMLGNIEMMRTSCTLAGIAVSDGDLDTAFNYLEDASNYAAEYDDMPQISSYSSPLLSLLTFDKGKIDAPDLDKNRSMREVCLSYILTLDCFEGIRYDKRMTKIYNILKINEIMGK